MKKAIVILTLVCLTLVSGAGAAFAQHAAPALSIQVDRVAFPVTLSDNQVYTVVGYLYTPRGNDKHTCEERRDTVQVLLHGGGYDHRYWDAGTINGSDYSYARDMAGRCYSVLALDRLGAGESSRPDGDLADKEQDASSIAQILTALRKQGNPSGRKFKNVVLVGHSFGSFSAIYTLGAHGNLADALVVTGWTNAPGVVPIDPEFIQALLVDSYIRLPDQVRTALFYSLDTTDPDVIEFDNATLSDTTTRGFVVDAVDVFTARALGDVSQIKALTKVDRVGVPVFVQLGDLDFLFPAPSDTGDEAGFYSGAPGVTVDTLSNIGHSFNLHTNHQAGWDNIAAWIGSTLGD
jgi:pimeloyl-ACP methyl ester carboxylesterase